MNCLFALPIAFVMGCTVVGIPALLLMRPADLKLRNIEPLKWSYMLFASLMLLIVVAYITWVSTFGALMPHVWFWVTVIAFLFYTVWHTDKVIRHYQSRIFEIRE